MSALLSTPMFILTAVAFLLGEPRDGLTLLNLQSSYLSVFSGLTEKVLGTLFLAFGVSQVLCQAPVAYLIESTRFKMPLLLAMAWATVVLSILTVQHADGSPTVLALYKILQGGVMTILPPCLNALTQGLVGPDLFSKQVSKNEMAAHAGTALFNLLGGIYSFYAYDSGNVNQIFYLPLVPLLIFTGVGVYFVVNFVVDEESARGCLVQESSSDKITPVSADESLLYLDSK